MKSSWGTLAGLLVGIALAAHAQNAEFKNPPELMKPNGYSHAVVIHGGKLIFISGQVGIAKDGTIAKDFAGQAKQAFANLKIALAACGASPANLVKVNYYVVGLDRAKLLALRDARDAVIDREHPPASTLAGVQALFRDDVQLEIDAEAVVP